MEGILQKMSDKRLLFLGSAFMVLLSLATVVWLLASGQAAYVDGLFLLLVAGVVALAFSLYLWFLINRALEELKPPKPGARKPAPPADAE